MARSKSFSATASSFRGFKSSLRTTFSSTSTNASLGILDDSTHDLALNAAQDRKEILHESLPQSLFKEEHDCIAPFHREEILLGPLLGSGEYSDVYEVESFRIEVDSAEHSALSAREQMKRMRMKKDETYRHRQTKHSRYALKHLKGSYLEKHNSDSYIQAAGDLAVEAEFLSSLIHPNIMKLRGITHSGCSGFGQGPLGYFLIIDRLPETLDKKIRQWCDANNNNGASTRSGRRSSFFIRNTKPKSDDGNVSKPELKGEAMDERLSIALQISAGIKYLHSHSIIFRDLKPANIGFDVRGDVKIFDFGLSRVMPQNGNTYNDEFEMSGAGSPRYMAPELLSGKKYNLKADVYSFAIILWQMLAEQTPYAFVRSRRQLDYHVVHEHGRPDIDDVWPDRIKGMLESSFSANFLMRPKISLFHEIIRTFLVNLRGGNGRLLSHAFINRRRSLSESRRSLSESFSVMSSQGVMSK